MRFPPTSRAPCGRFQRDLQNELTREGLAAAWARAKIGVLDDVRQAYRTGTSIAALSRRDRVSWGAIRTAVADLLPGQPQRPITATAEPDTRRALLRAANALNADGASSAERKASHLP